MLDAAFLVALLAAFFAGFAAGLTGFGFALISGPLFLLVYDPSTVVALIVVLGVFIIIDVVRDSYREADWRAVLALLPAALLGLFVGVEVLAAVDLTTYDLGWASQLLPRLSSWYERRVCRGQRGGLALLSPGSRAARSPPLPDLPGLP